MLMVIFLVSIAVLLFCIIKLKLNAFVALLVTAFGTGIACSMPLNEVADVVTNKFGATLGGIGMVTGLGVMLGMFMYESGGIDNISNGIIKKLGDARSQYAVSLSGFITGIPVFGDVVYIMFAPMLRVLSRKTGYSMAAYACAISTATTCTFALVLPTAPPLAVAENLGLEIGIFFFYALISAFVGMFVAGILYGGILNSIDQRNGRTWDFSDMDRVDAQEKAAEDSARADYFDSVRFVWSDVPAQRRVTRLHQVYRFQKRCDDYRRALRRVGCSSVSQTLHYKHHERRRGSSWSYPSNHGRGRYWSFVAE